MKHILLILTFVTTSVCGQNYWKIQDNNKPDSKHKKYPSYIEIDTSQIKDLKQVIVKYNSELITGEGNKYYLKTKPFIDKTTISVGLTEKGNADFKKFNATKPKDKFITSTEFNEIHKDDFYKIYSKSDSVIIGSAYESYIEIDTNKIKDINSLKVFFYSVPLKRKVNKYYIKYMPMFVDNFYNISITNYGDQNDTIKFTRNVRGVMPERTNSSSLDYVVIADKMPIFNSKTYNSFDDYLIKSIKKENLKIYGKLFIDYTVMKDGTTRFDGIKKGEISDMDKSIIEKAVTQYKNWTPGEDKGKILNVKIYAVYNFK